MLAVLFFPWRTKGREAGDVSAVLFFLGGGGRAKGREETGVVFAVLFFTVADEEKEGCVDRRAVNEET